MYALDIAREIFEEAAAAGMQLRIMDIGGGFPIPEPKVRFNLQEMLNQINARLDEDFREWNLGRPGRFICGTAVNLITSVIGVTERGGQRGISLMKAFTELFPACFLTSGTLNLSALKKASRWPLLLQGQAVIRSILCSAAK